MLSPNHLNPVHFTDDDLLYLAKLSQQAGAEILRIQKLGFDVSYKNDESPLTLADLAAHTIITDGLNQRFADIAIVSEEDGEDHSALEATDALSFLVDPLDGTKEFINNRDSFTVNIALIENRAPVYGIIYAPARKALFVGDAKTKRAFAYKGDCINNFDDLEPIHISPMPHTSPRCVSSFSHTNIDTQNYLAQIGAGERLSIGSSLKFCLVAQGLADVYPRLGPTMEWDTAAGDAILRAAGGRVVDRQGQPLLYAKTRFYNLEFFALGDIDFTPPLSS